MKDLKQEHENAMKVARIVENLDVHEQQRAVDIVTSFALGVQFIKGDEGTKNQSKLKEGDLNENR